MQPDATNPQFAAQFASKIDHTILKPEALAADVDAVVRDAIAHRFASVCVAANWVRYIAPRLSGSGVKVCSVVGFPHGTSKSTVKAIEATAAVKDGAEEVDVVAFLPHLLNLDLDAAREELSEIARASRAANPRVLIKVIVESAALSAAAAKDGAKFEAMIALACEAVRESGCDFIKTSTGFHPAGGASPLAVKLMKQHSGGVIQVKASGGIRDLATAQDMLAAGADRLGLSASVAIMGELAGKSNTDTKQKGGY